MAGSLKTKFFNLVKYAANDITSWLTDFNGNMDKIDAAMNENKTATQTAQDGVDNLETEYESLLSVVNGHTTSIDANEKAIAANAASIAEIENEVNEIIIGDYAIRYGTDDDVTKIETHASSFYMLARRVGMGIEVNGYLTLTSGNLHSYDRQIPTGILANRYVTDIYRITGNPFNLPHNVYCPFNGALGSIKNNLNIASANYNVLINYGEILLAAAYLADSGYTVIGVISSSPSPYDISKGDIATIVF